jgi:hypothetical protein
MQRIFLSRAACGILGVLGIFLGCGAVDDPGEQQWGEQSSASISCSTTLYPVTVGKDIQYGPGLCGYDLANDLQVMLPAIAKQCKSPTYLGFKNNPTGPTDPSLAAIGDCAAKSIFFVFQCGQCAALKTPTCSAVGYRDQDGDGLGNPKVSKYICEPEVGWVTNKLDCDDHAYFGMHTYCVDADGDGYAKLGSCKYKMVCPKPGYLLQSKSKGWDCKDNDKTQQGCSFSGLSWW